jgi:hypothetical protein
MQLDQVTKNMLAGMAFDLAGAMIVYFVVGSISLYFFIGIAFVIAACSVVVGVANHFVEDDSEEEEEAVNEQQDQEGIEAAIWAAVEALDLDVNSLGNRLEIQIYLTNHGIEVELSTIQAVLDELPEEE